MAMFLSRIKQILNLGTKSITANGTYNASTDGYDGYSSVEVNVPQITPTSITPSNSTPAALTANTPVNPTVNGYAIASYDSVTPSSTPTSVSTNDIVKIGGSGVIVDSVPPTPTSITPSNSSPVTLSANTPVNPTDGGYAIESYEEITPKNSNPPTLLLGHIYKIKTRNGIAIGAANTVFPSDDDPPLLPVGSYNFVNGASGYLYSSSGLGKCKSGTVTLSTSSTTTVTCGFEPKYISLIVYKDATHFSSSVYNKDVSTSNTYRGAINGGSAGCASQSFPVTSTSTTGLIMSTSSTGFKVAATSTTHGTTAYYFAIG